MLGQLAIGYTRKVQNGVDDLSVLAQIHQLAHGSFRGATDELELLDLLFHVELRAMDSGAQLGRQWAQVRPLLINLGVVTLDNMQLRHGDTRDEPLLVDVRHHTVGHSQLIWGIMVAGLGDDIALHAEPLGGLIRKGRSKIAEDLVVRAGLPWRVNGRVEGVQVRVHIRRGHIVLLVPSSGREDEIGYQRGGGIAEIRGHHEVEFALRGFIDPLDGARAILWGELFCGGVGVDAKEVAEEELRALRRGAQQVGAPIKQDARPVFFCRRVVIREFEAAAF